MNSAAHSPHILCVGTDRLLLDTRCKVLATRYRASCLCGIQHVADLQPAGAFAVVVLCHTLLPNERGAVALQLRHLWHGIKILQIVLSHRSEVVSGATVITATAGPAALLAAVGALLPA